VDGKKPVPCLLPRFADPLHRTAVAQDDKKKNNYKVLRLVGRRATSSLGMTGTKLTVVNA
jgi:hypothetical protein